MLRELLEVQIQYFEKFEHEFSRVPELKGL